MIGARVVANRRRRRRGAERGRGRDPRPRRPAPAVVVGPGPIVLLTPEPFAGDPTLDLAALGSGIADSYAGNPVRVRFTVVDAIARRPVPNALLEIRHAPSGARGVAIADKDGIARIRTTRVPAPDTTVLDLRVFVGGDALHAGRLTLPDRSGEVDALLAIGGAP